MRTPALADGCVKGGLACAATDEMGWAIARDPVHIDDWHATIPNLFGIHHLKLTQRFNGLDTRRTGVVVSEWTA